MNAQDFLFPESGEMGRLCRAFDWSATPLGPAAEWPDSLRTAAGLALGSALPTIIFWGEELVQIYNDEYRPFQASRHPVSLGRPLRDVWPESWEFHQPLCARVRNGEPVPLQEWTHWRGAPRGQVQSDLSYAPILMADGSVGGVLVTLIHANLRVRRAEQRQEAAEAATRAEEGRLLHAVDDLRKSEEKYRVLMEQASEGIFVQPDLDEGFIDLNTTACEMLGYHREELLGKKPSEILHADNAVERAQRHAHLRSGRTLLTQRTAARKDGSLFPVELHTKVLPDGRVQTFAKDVSERVEREKRLRRAERLASLGTLISGVAHELNNPLHAIQNFAQLLLEEEHSLQKREDLETIKRESARMARIVSQLRLVARAESHDDVYRDDVDINDVIQHVVRTRARELEAGQIRLTLQLEPSISLVHADRSQLEQVLLNLMVNAEQALRSLESGERRIWIRTSVSGEQMHLEIADNGPGIPEADLERIFDPFWTSKNPGEGTGLGLSLAQRIVTEHRGELRVKSPPGEGATFCLILPAKGALNTAAGIQPLSADTVTVEPRPPLNVLVVDDEGANRRVLVRALVYNGHSAEEAADGSQALSMLELKHYDLIVSDLRMPGMGGEELLRHLRARRPDLAERLILLTGDPAGAMNVIGGSNTPILLKPLQLDEAVAVIERHAESLNRPGGSERLLGS